MSLIKFGFAISGLMLGSFAVHADITNGKTLHAKGCTACHTSSVYSRSDRKITSLPALQLRVDGCSHPAGVSWSQQEMKDVVDYLNTEFYHFK